MLISKTCLHTVSRYETWILVMYKSCFIGQNGSNIAHIDILLESIVYIGKHIPIFYSF